MIGIEYDMHISKIYFFSSSEHCIFASSFRIPSTASLSLSATDRNVSLYLSVNVLNRHTIKLLNQATAKKAANQNSILQVKDILVHTSEVWHCDDH